MGFNYEQVCYLTVVTVTGQTEINISNNSISIYSISIMNQVNVDNKVVILSGGAGGLGRSLADLVLTRGGHVYVCDIDKDSVVSVIETMTQKHKDGKISGCELDVRSEDNWKDAWKKCVDTLGQPDILVNIAGIKGEQDWEKMYDINVKGVHHGINTARKNMSKESGGKGGVVVNVSSTCGVTCHGDMYATPAYTASKHTVTALTRTFGHKFWQERTGVSIVAVAPYYIDTPFLGSWQDWTEDAEAQEVLKQSAQGKKFLEPDEAALKIFNVFNSQSGSVWLVRPGMMPPFNVPDYKLPQPKFQPSTFSIQPKLLQ